MASTNKTSHYGLSQFLATDKASWLGDVNADMSKIDTAIFNAATSANGAESSAGSAVAVANEAKTAADAVKDVADSANTTATTANANATKAINDAATALSAAQNAASAASTAQNTADTAQSNIASVKATADSAQSTATAASGLATSASQAASEAQTTAGTANSNASTALGTANSALGAAQAASGEAYTIIKGDLTGANFKYSRYTAMVPKSTGHPLIVFFNYWVDSTGNAQINITINLPFQTAAQAVNERFPAFRQVPTSTNPTGFLLLAPTVTATPSGNTVTISCSAIEQSYAMSYITVPV